MNPTVYYRWQYCRDDIDVTGYGFCIEDLDEARAWSGAHGDLLVASLVVGSYGRWHFGSSDLFGRLLPGSCVTFASPAAAMRHLALRVDRNLAVARCRCGQPGAECD